MFSSWYSTMDWGSGIFDVSTTESRSRETVRERMLCFTACSSFARMSALRSSRLLNFSEMSWASSSLSSGSFFSLMLFSVTRRVTDFPARALVAKSSGKTFVMSFVSPFFMPTISSSILYTL